MVAHQILFTTIRTQKCFFHANSTPGQYIPTFCSKTPPILTVCSLYLKVNHDFTYVILGERSYRRTSISGYYESLWRNQGSNWIIGINIYTISPHRGMKKDSTIDMAATTGVIQPLRIPLAMVSLLRSGSISRWFQQAYHQFNKKRRPNIMRLALNRISANVSCS
jgi:hypothetical protein